MKQLKALEAITFLSLTSSNIHELIKTFSPICIMALRPTIAGTIFSCKYVIDWKQTSIGTCKRSLYTGRIQVKQNTPRNIPVSHCF